MKPITASDYARLVAKQKALELELKEANAALEKAELLAERERVAQIAQSRALAIARNEAFAELSKLVTDWAARHDLTWNYPADSRMISQVKMPWGGSVLITAKRRI